MSEILNNAISIKGEKCNLIIFPEGEYMIIQINKNYLNKKSQVIDQLVFKKDDWVKLSEKIITNCLQHDDINKNNGH